ncbi:hypothetical protein ALC56_14977, partial [Trachymyrmex septentrionalis]
DHIYVYLSENSTMLRDKQFDLDTSDFVIIDGVFVIIDGVKYKGTPGLYELIFKRIPNTIYTDNDEVAYKSILLATKCSQSGSSNNKIQVGTGIPHARKLNKKLGKKVGKGIIPHAMTLNENKMDYVHWDDPNELVDLRLLEASRQAGYNAHDNKILSIVEELREAGYKLKRRYAVILVDVETSINNVCIRSL